MIGRVVRLVILSANPELPEGRIEGWSHFDTSLRSYSMLAVLAVRYNREPLQIGDIND